jgi:hypothetical protein
MDLWNLEQSNKLSPLQGTVDFLNVKSIQFWPQINERYMSSILALEAIKNPIGVCVMEQSK